MLAYFFPLFGAMIADSFLGKFKTVVYVSVIYAIGNIALTLAATAPLSLPSREISLIGLFLIALGTGGIKPCVAPFGGDQFKLPEQAKLLAAYFSLFYFIIYLGSLLATLITPVLRGNTHCFGDETCFPLAFGFPAILMFSSIGKTGEDYLTST